MKTWRNIFLLLAGGILTASIALTVYGFTIKGKPMDAKNVTIVAAGDGYKELESEKAADEGRIIATATASCQVSGYSPSFAVDGDIESYWEGIGEYPQYIVFAFENKTEVDRMVLKLNPIEIWGRRTQAFSIEASDDGENFRVVSSDSSYIFDWAEGNTVEIRFLDEPLETKFVRLVFSSNSGGGGGQLAEVIFYAA